MIKCGSSVVRHLPLVQVCPLFKKVCPLFKKGDKTEPSNYRPISLTCILCKVMEHIIAVNLSTHLNKHNILYELQHGFREKRSCETKLIQLVEDLGRQLSYNLWESSVSPSHF